MKSVLIISLLLLLKICPNPYGLDDSEFVEFYCNSSCVLSDGESTLFADKGLHIATKNKTEFYRHFNLIADLEFPRGFALSNRGEEICLIENGSRDCFYYGKDIEFLDEGVIYFRTERSWDFRYEDWSDFKPVSDFVNGRILISPCNYNVSGVVASYTFSRIIDGVEELYVDSSPVSIPCQELMYKNVHFLKSKSYRCFHYKFAVNGSKVVVTTENWRFTKKGYIVEFKSKSISKALMNLLKNDLRYETMIKPSKCEFWKEVRVTEKGKEIEFKANITLYILPDYNPIFDFISSAERRLYIEAPYISFKWYKNESELFKAIEIAKNSGAEVLVVLDSRYKKKSDLNHLNDLGVKTLFVRGIHGKVVVADNRVLITSANLNLYGLKLNREIALIIESEKVADFIVGNIKKEFNPIFAIPSIAVFAISLLLLLRFRR